MNKNRESRKSRMSKRHVEYLLRDIVDYDFVALRDANRVLSDDSNVNFIRDRVSREMRATK